VRNERNKLLHIAAIVAHGEGRETSFDGDIFDKTVDHRLWNCTMTKLRISMNNWRNYCWFMGKYFVYLW
jgi:hypothetical protein